MVREILDALGDVEVLVVDDDSPDRTWEAVETRLRRRPARSRPPPGGPPRAPVGHRRGHRGTRGDVVVWLDADGSMPADVIPQLVAATADADVAVASRYAAGGRDARDSDRPHPRVPRDQRLRHAVRSAGRCGTGPRASWRPGGRRSSACRSAPDHVYGDYCIDFLHRACRQGLRVVEVPYACVERRAGTTKTSPSLRRFAALGLRYVQTIRRLRRASRTEENRP